MDKTALKRKEVTSSHIRSIGHSYPRRMLEVEFKDGSVYRYKGVKRKTFRELMDADSKGRAMHQLVRHQYPYKKVKAKDGTVTMHAPYREEKTAQYAGAMMLKLAAGEDDQNGDAQLPDLKAVMPKLIEEVKISAAQSKRDVPGGAATPSKWVWRKNQARYQN